MGKRLTFVLGGVRAGKSSYAQHLAEGAERVLFVATAEAGDQEMKNRIEAHRERRPPDWETLEEPTNLVASLRPLLPHYTTVLLDCLTLWVSNLLLRGSDRTSARHAIVSEAEGLLSLYRHGDASWIVVSNEVGFGVMPANNLSREYSDELGSVNQLVAAEANAVYLLVAGLPLKVKDDRGGQGFSAA
ncbi:MAG: bifunctional adenosylcobinamide kinase/adenosylcobinamide-phosphate guanylyltransferase [Actinomycetia bacterium]|nr:bifunctional adenosylcobinamide kinase/adenosylcobinamide-phosphate guanylyltransferase [Actinomycetes bacterium]